MRKFAILLWVLVCLPAFAWAQGPGPGGQEREDDHDDRGPIQVGYAIVTPAAATTSGIVVFESFGLRKGDETSQAGILPSEMTRNALLFVSSHGRLSRNLGVAIANPGTTAASVTLTLRGENGSMVGSKTVDVAAGRQLAQFVSEMFADRSEVPRDLTGTLSITSNNAVALVGLRFRGSNFSTLPVTNLSPPTAVPSLAPGVGGPGAVILAHFATGGGWATEIVIANPNEVAVTVRVDLFKQDATALTVRMNNESRSTFNLTVPARGVATLAPRDRGGDSRF